MELLNIKECDIHGKKVFIRCDFNVPMDDYGNITDDRRIRSALSTISYCLDQKCGIILASHFGRPKGEPDDKYSLAPIARRLHQLLKIDVKMAEDVVGESARKLASELQSGE